MGIFDLFKKKDLDETPPPVYGYDCTTPTEHHFTINLTKSDLKRLTKEKPKEPDLSHLDEDDELPFGWFYQNKEFVNKIENEYRYFLNLWLTSRGKDVRAERDALKSFIRYMKDVQNLCDSKGECFSSWCSGLIGKEQLEKRQKDLQYIEEHFDELLEKEACKRDIEQNLLPHLRADLIEIIKRDQGILQTDVYKLFDEAAKEYISSELYCMEKDKLIIREKAGRTYSITI